jgi:hypothetical protein
MREHKQLDEFNDLELGLLGEGGEEAGELVLGEGQEGGDDGGLLLLGLPLLEEGLVGGLEVESHGAEAGSLEVEVEVLVVL